jgi:hypothetical protein
MISHLVKATREGLVGDLTSTGYKIDKYVPFVALPDAHALYLAVIVTNPINNKSICAIVMDVGPWNIHDTNYVFGSARPQAESGLSVSGHGTNKAGIDLSEHIWNYLEMKDNTNVYWRFVDLTR